MSVCSCTIIFTHLIIIISFVYQYCAYENLYSFRKEYPPLECWNGRWPNLIFVKARSVRLVICLFSTASKLSPLIQTSFKCLSYIIFFYWVSKRFLSKCLISISFPLNISNPLSKLFQSRVFMCLFLLNRPNLSFTSIFWYNRPIIFPINCNVLFNRE